MKRASSHTGDEANGGRQRTLAELLLLPATDPCFLTREEENVLAQHIVEYHDGCACCILFKSCYQPLLRYYARRTWGDVFETENLVQETFLRAWKGLCAGSWQGKSFHSWLFGIANNAFKEWLRDKLVESASIEMNAFHSADEVESPDSQDTLDDLLLKIALWKLVLTLPWRDQQVLYLHLHCQLTIEETAALLHCSISACKMRYTRALQRLRTKIEQAGLDEEFCFDNNTALPG